MVDIMIWLVLFVAALTIVYIFYLHTYRKYNEGISQIPSPPTLPVVGNAFDFKGTSDLIPKMLEYAKKYGGIYKIRIGPFKPKIVFADVKSAEFILTHTTNITKSCDYGYLYNWLGTGLLTSTGDKWRRHRKLITPTFHFKVLEDFIDVFNSAGNVLVEKLEKEVEKKSFDVYPYITLCALDVICETAMGTSINAQNNDTSDYVKSVKQMCRIIIDRTFSPLKMFDFFYFFSKDYRIEKQSLKILHSYSQNVIRNRKLELASKDRSKESNKEADEGLGIKKKLAFLDLLMQECEKQGSFLSDTDLREEVDTFMFEGHDTTASGMSFILYCLSLNPEPQQKVYEELNNVFEGDNKRPPSYQQLQDLKYLEMVIKESLRLYPSVPFYARSVTEDLVYDGMRFPKDIPVVIFAYGIHRDPKIFPDPEKFVPERFAASETKSRSPFAYIPFSAGARNCIGQKFAMLEMKAIVSKVVRHYKILPAEPRHEVILTSETVMKSSNGIRIRLEKR